MIGSKEHIDFINEYISAYEEKIKLANENHLFDEAQLFELFAQEICKIWYDQNFSNLNLIKYNYPCVDLISEDKSIYVQVSTQKDIFSKIKNTLEALKNTDKPELKSISSPVFFVLSSESEHKVKDLIGEDKIGAFSFTVDNNLISTAKIVQRASSDLEFQTKLYDFLKHDVEGLSTIAEIMLNQFAYSKDVGLMNIDTKINAEYEIDRTDLIHKIKSEANQFCLVCGEAGSGKSAICKKLLEDECRVLFARADRLEKCNSIDEIWNISISKAFNYLKGKRIVIYFDALEYIANSGDSIKELLQTLLYEISKHSEIAFIASCRSCDTNAFIKLIGIYKIKEYIVDFISDNELKGICDKYSQIKEMSLSGKYSELLRSPFYINEIVSKNICLSKSSDVNEFRDYIWKECICLNTKAIEKGISTTEVISAVEYLVFERSKRMATGIDEDELDSRILSFLSSNNVVTKNERLIRLKYDIYEDICFERRLDNIFNSCRGIYSVFFAEVEQMGNGAYRRYQIWISNKLLAKENRDKFLYELVFHDRLSEKWQKNTIIGLVKSPFCESFFEEQGTNLIEKQVISDFVDLVNCFAFDMTGFYADEYKSLYVLHLKACGQGRNSIIHLIHNKELYKTEIIEKRKIIKLCKDYATRSEHQEKTSVAVCDIIGYYLSDFSISNTELTEELKALLYQLLEILYSLPTTAHSFISAFWMETKNCYKSSDTKKSRDAEEILSWTLKHVTVSLVDELLDDLLDIAETIWTYETERDKKSREFYGHGIDNDYLWGIHGAGDNYRHDYPKIANGIFLRLIYQRNIKKSLDWTVLLINKMVSSYSNNCPDDICTIKLFDCEKNIEKNFIGTDKMWFAGREDFIIPTLIGDMVYWLKETIIQMISTCQMDKELVDNLSAYVKNEIFDNSTNVIPFVVIEDIGFRFPDLLPAYANVLASSSSILYWDLQWEVHNTMTPAQAILKKQITMSFGVPALEDRYPRNSFRFKGIQEYVARNQLEFGDIARKKSVALIDHLYKMVDESDSVALLQIQKMDMRNANRTVINDEIEIITPRLTEGPQRIVDENKPIFSAEQKIYDSLYNLLENRRLDNLEEVLHTLDYIKSHMDTREHIVEYENYYIMVLVVALNSSTLLKEKRTELVCDWVDRIENIITRKSSYVADLNLSSVLFEQCRNELCIEAKKKLRRLMLSCLVDCSSDGQISALRRMIVKYLYEDEATSQCFFNTLIQLSEDEWKHASYNQKQLRKNKRKGYCISGFNRVPTPDDIVVSLGLKPYVSKRKEIIERFLYYEEAVEICNININHLDPGYLFIAMNVGMHLSNDAFFTFCKQIMPLFVQTINSEHQDSTMDTYFQRLRVKELFERELTDLNGDYRLAVNLLFDDVDYSKFVHETNRTYLSIFEHLYSVYFDSYKDKLMRKHCRDCIKYVETKIERISIPFIKHELEGILIFSTEFIWSDWNRCETHYSYEDKTFMCGLWSKYILGHENAIIRTMYQMKTGELLPEVLSVIAQIVDALDKKGESLNEDCLIILKTIVLRSLLDFSDMIKSDEELHNSYEKVLSSLISQNDESAAVILDEYRTH